MKAIWKFPLRIEDTQEIEMPAGARILTVQAQFGVPCLWALVRSESPRVRRTIRTIGTGHPISDDFPTLSATASSYDGYIGTYQLSDGNLVFHVFEVT